MKQRRTSRFLAIVLLVAMTLSLMPTSLAYAEESSTWTQTTLDQITAEDTVAITMTANGTTYALPTAAVTNEAPVAEVVSPDGSTLTLGSAADYGWTITPGEGGTYTIAGPNGGINLINNNKGVRINGASATWTYDANVARFQTADTSGNQRYLSVAVQLDTPDWRCYKTDSSYSVGTTTLWKLTGGETPDPTDPPEPTEPPVVTITPIGDVLAAASGEFTVQGVVTMVDGKNVYVQDATGGICLYLPSAATDIELGDTLIGTGTYANYKGLPELSGATYEKSEGMELTAKTTTLGELSTADVCTYVYIEKLTVVAVEGTTITVMDDAGDSLQIYKAVTGDTTYAENDIINFTGAVGIFNNLQLRNTKAEEITRWVAPEAPVDPGLVILFTNDVHCGIEDGWGYAGLADLKKSLEAEGNTVLLVDAGDHVQGGPIGTLSEGAYIIDIMNFVGYDVAVPGNHEFDYTMPRFFANVERANYPYVSANFMNYVDGEPTTPVLDAYKIFEADGKKVAIVGVCTPETLTKSTPTYFQNEDGEFIYGFGQDTTGEGLYTATQAAVDAARAEGVDYVILVGHLGIDEQSSPWTAPEVIANVSGVDAVIDGHSHSVINTQLTDKDGKTVLHGQTGTKLANIGKLSFLEDGSLKIELLPASEKVQDDADTAEYIAGVKAQYESLLQEVVAYTPYDLTTKDPDTGNRAVRSAETNLGDLCADAYLYMLDADVAFVNGGGVRADIPAGEITYEQILNVHPFGNAACLVEVSGQQILDALEMGARVCPGENGGFLQVAGLTYEIHTSLEPNVTIDESKMWVGTAGKPYRVQNVQVLNKETGEYEPLDLTKTYRLASHNYMLKNQGDGFAMFGIKNVTVLQDEVMLDNKVLINYIQSLPGDGEHEHAVIETYSNPRGAGRITIVPEEPEPPVVLPAYTEAPKDGDKVVIYNVESGVVMGLEDYLYNNTKHELTSVSATLNEDGTLTPAEGYAYLTVQVDENGKYSFLNEEGKHLLVDGTNVQFVDEANENTLFQLETAEGGFYIKCDTANYNGKAQYLQYYKNYFTCFGLNSNTGRYIFAFYGEPAPVAKTGLVTDLADLTDGSYVVIYNPGHTLAMTSETYQDWYLLGAEATITEGEVTEPAANQIWKVTVNEDGTYTFTQDSYTIAAWLSGNYVELTNNGAYNEATATGWTLETCNAETSTFYMYSSTLTGSNGHAYIEAYYKKQVSGDTFCGYSPTADKLTEKDYGMQFYLVPAPEKPDEPTPSGNTYGLTSTLSDGDTVLLYNAASGMALGNSLSNYKVTGVALTPAEGVITTDDASVAWKVTVNADGTYTFTQGDLTLGGSVRVSGDKTYNNITLSEPTATKWTLSGPDAADFNYYMYLGEMTSSFGNTYLEYYSGFTLYGSTEDKLNKNAYGITFYKQGAEAEVPSGGEEPGDDTIKVGTLVTSLDQLTDGSTVLIYSPTHKTAASSVPNGDWYIKAVGPVTDTFTAPLVWTVTRNEDGSFRFSNGENVLSAWPKDNYVELTVNGSYNAETVSDWNVAQCNAATHTWYISSTTLTVNDKTAYVEAFLRNGTEVFSGYATNSPSEKDYGLQFYIVDPADASEETDDGVWDGVLNKGQQYVIYNASAEGVLGIPNEMGNALTNVPATIAGGKATVSNGALVFTVADTLGRYYVLEVGGKYLATNNAEELFFSDEINEYTKWYLTKNGSGYLLYNKTANYNGTPVCIEFFSGGFSGWTFKSTDADIFRFNFYPVADGTAVVSGVAQVPSVQFACEDSRYIEQDYEVKFTLDDLAPEITNIDITYTVGGVTNTVTDYTVEGKTYSFTIPASELDAQGVVESFKLTVQVTNSYELAYQGIKTVTVLDEPFIGKLTPAANAQTMDDKRPVISAEIGNVGENAVFTMTVNDQPVEASYADGVLSYQAAEDMADGRVTVIVTVTRADGKTAEKMWSFYVGKAQYQLYFGQLHSHTTYSDGSGSLEAALEYVEQIPASANVQFVAFTDHSNYFDSTSAANPEAALYDVSQMTTASKATWDSYKNTVAAFNAKQSDIIAIAGFEMTWSGGPGHINTFNTPGIVSRNNSTLNNKTNDAGMRAYYALLDNEALVDGVSQFNHPGKTFGNFTDFSYWDAVTDSRIYLVEVGNGEGQIGAGGYYPSYEQYIMALDKGWHVGPTNNQDNHKGRWGNANDARDVLYTDDFSEQGIYQAIRDYRIYATEDKNLEIQYNVNDEPLGTIFSEVPEELNFVVTVYDPDSSDAISKVELVVNSGAVAYTWDDANELASGQLEVTLAPTYSYYFVRVTQKDGDLAVTAPVWVGESLKLGISSVECSASTPVTGEEFTLTTTFYNSESKPATIKSITYTTNGNMVLGTDTAAGEIPASSTSTAEFKYTPDKAKIMTITVTAIVELDGVEYTFSKDIQLEIKDADALVYIGIDASHYNEYVAGNYKDSMGNFGALAAGYGVRTVELKTSEELIAACSNEKYVAIIFTAPSRRLAAAQSDPKTYSDDELAAIAAFNQAGGQVIVCGWGDNYENYNLPEGTKHMAATQNELLAALGSNIRLGDDEVMDDELNGGQTQRLYFNAYNFDSYLMEGVEVDPEHPNDREYTEVYSNYGGCSVFFNGDGVPATVTPIVFGHESTYTKDCDGDGRNEMVYPYGDGNRVVVMASEQLDGQGLIIVAGAAFMSNFEVQAKISDGSTDADNQKNYSNYKICENLVKGFNELTITPIAEVQAQTEIGLVYTIEGTVTSNASGYDKDTAFFDCIYVQDETAGICCFPVSGNYKIGDRVRITGYTDFYQAEMELQVMSIEIIGETDPVEPTEVTAAQINDLSYLGTLVTLNGTVESFEYENGLIQTIMVKDANGDVARVFIDGYITTAEDVQNLTVGCQISATGLSSYDDTWKDTNYFPRIRIRNRADIICTEAVITDAAIVAGKSLSLKGKIALNFYLELPETLLEDEGAYVTINDEQFPISKAKTIQQNGKTLYRFTVNVKFAQLTEERVLHVYTGEGELAKLLKLDGTDLTESGYAFKAQDYIEVVRETSEDEKLLQLVNALSDVGSLAQLQFNYNVDSRVEVVGDLDSVTADSISQFAMVLNVKEGAGISYYGSSLLLQENTVIRHYFTVTGSISQYTFKVDGKKVTPVKKGSYYYIEIKDVSAKDLDKSFHVEVSTKTEGVVVSLDYSAMSYIYKQLATGESGTLIDLMKALVLYNQAADAYFGG